MVDLSQIQLIKLQKHQLNNQGCRCQMCQKLIKQQTMKIVIQKVQDHESEGYGESTKQFYIKLISKIADWDKKPRKLRFLLPQICVYQNSQPLQLITKKYQNTPIKIIRDKSKMHMFQIIQFFLQGFVFHNPERSKKTNRKKATSFFIGNYTQKYKNQCILIAKYRNNIYNMLTLTQIQSLFKSRYKYMRDGLMYLQTLVCTTNFNQIRINLIIKDLLKTQRYQKAKNEIKIFHGQIKSSDLQYVSEQDQIKYQNQLKQKSMRDYLEYLSVKIILALSRMQSTIISESVFKYVHSSNLCYLIDLRINKIQSSQEFWATAVLKAFQYRLNRRMSMMDVGLTSYPNHSQSRYLSRKTQNLSAFLQKSTQSEWDEMRIIKTRLQRLEKQKKSLLQSQSAKSAVQNKSQLVMNKSFKIRNMLKH